MAQSYVGKLEQQNKDLKQQLTNAKEEINSHLEALDVSKDWHDKQKQELLDKNSKTWKWGWVLKKTADSTHCSNWS